MVRDFPGVREAAPHRWATAAALAGVKRLQHSGFAAHPAGKLRRLACATDVEVADWTNDSAAAEGLPRCGETSGDRNARRHGQRVKSFNRIWG